MFLFWWVHVYKEPGTALFYCNSDNFHYHWPSSATSIYKSITVKRKNVRLCLYHLQPLSGRLYPSRLQKVALQPGRPQYRSQRAPTQYVPPTLPWTRNRVLIRTVANIGSVSTFSLRSIQHTDHEGRVITEPDLSNPTRHRFERPLDTIRNFEAAIDRHRRDY